jgi:uncharacterized DUF497 family protein
MDYSKLSNYQLFELIQNEKLNQSIRVEANTEFEKRNISLEEKKEIISKHDAVFVPDKGETLSEEFKILILAFPFPFLLYIRHINRTYGVIGKKEWKVFWKNIYLGLAAWTIGFLIIAKFIL